MKQALIIGLGVSGCSAAEFLLHHGWRVFAVEKNPKICKQDVAIIGPEDIHFVSQCQLVVISPGIPRSNPFYKAAVTLGVEVVDEAEMAMRHLKVPILGITGTNGKTTVTYLVEHTLNNSGIKAKALGNIGEPLAAYSIAPDDNTVVVAELSSYQLECMTTPSLDAAVVLNITPDHLDRYDSFEHYAQAKVSIARNLKPGGELFLHDSIPLQFPQFVKELSFKTFGHSQDANLWTDKEKVVYEGKIAYFFPLHYRQLGMHDCENALAAWALVKRLGVTPEQFCASLETFRKPPHRIEFVGEVDGVRFYDDSKGTNIDATIHAVKAVSGPVVLIAGGVDKGASYLPWAAECREKIVHIVAIGQAAEKIKSELKEYFSLELAADFQSAVTAATAKACPGHVVLLSPGCSSFDMFRDYVHRGEVFQDLVKKLITRRSS